MTYLKCDRPDKISYPATNISGKKFIEEYEFKTKLEIDHFGNYPLTNEYWLALFYPLPEGSQCFDTQARKHLIKIGDDLWSDSSTTTYVSDRKIYGFKSFQSLSCPVNPLKSKEVRND